MKACVVRHKDTKEYYMFTLGVSGEILITDSRDFDIKNLIVSLVPLKEVQILDNDYYVVMQGEHGE